jgi:hypothetical protein
MPAIFEVGLTYQVHDEVLETKCKYRDPSSLTSISPVDLIDLATQVDAAVIASGIGALLGDPWVYYGATATTWKDEAENKGPGRYIVANQQEIGSGAAAINEAFYLNWTMRGTDVLGEVTIGGVKISGIPGDKVLCNTLEDDYRVDALTAIEQIFPAVRTVNGTPFDRGVWHFNKTLGIYTFVICASSDLSNRVGTDSTRRGNRSQARGKIVPVPP